MPSMSMQGATIAGTGPTRVIYQEPGCMVDMAAKAKGVVRIPVISVGKLDDPQLAERVIAEGRADMVALGKALLADASGCGRRPKDGSGRSGPASAVMTAASAGS